MTKRPKTLTEENDVPNEFIQGIAARVKEARKRRGLTLVQLSELADLVPSYLHTLETGGGNVSMKTFGKLAAALEVSPRDLMPESPQDLLSIDSVSNLLSGLQEAIAQQQASQALVLERLSAVVNFISRLQSPAGKGEKGEGSDS